MSKNIEDTLKLALEALDFSTSPSPCVEELQDDAIAAIKEALSSPNGEAQPEWEPVGEAHLMQEGFTHCIWSEYAVPVGTKLYTTPPQRKCENCGEFGTCCLKALAHDAQNKENT